MVTRTLCVIVAVLSHGCIALAGELMEAVQSGDLQAVQAHLDAGADPNEQDEHGNVPLLAAIVRNHHDITLALLEAGADPQLLGELVQPAVGGLKPDTSANEAIAALAQAGLDFSIEDPTKGEPILIRALGSPETIRVLGEVGANPNQIGFTGKTPIHVACEKGERESILALLDIGADPFAASRDGYLPISGASGTHLPDNPLIEIYVERAEESEEAARSIGFNPLMIAAYRRDGQAIRRLLDEDYPVAPGWYTGPTALQCLLMSPGDDPIELTRALIGGVRRDRDRVIEEQILRNLQGANEEVKKQILEQMLPTSRNQPEGPELGVVLADLQAAMTVASSKDYVESFRAILEYGQDRAQHPEGARLAALEAAVNGSSPACAAAAIEAIGEDLGRSSSNLARILTLAVESVDPELAMLVVGAVPPASERDWTLGPVVDKAVAKGWTGLVVALLDLGEDPNGDPPRSDQYSRVRPINAAAASGNLELVDLVLERGAIVAVPTAPRERSAFELAAEHPESRVFQRLVEHVKASDTYDADARQELLNEALLGAAISLDEGLLRLVLDAGGVVDPEDGWRCALRPPLEAGSFDLVVTLGDTVDLKQADDDTAWLLYNATLGAPNRLELIEELHERGLTLTGNVGRNVFYSALESKRTDVAIWLIDHDADLTTSEDQPMLSPLLWAATDPNLLARFCQHRSEIVAAEGERALGMLIFVRKDLDAADVLIDAGVRWDEFEQQARDSLLQIEDEAFRERVLAALRGSS